MAENGRLRFEIKHQWDGNQLQHDSILVELSTLHTESDVVEMSVTAPLFDETPLPRHALPGEPFYRLWEYEVVEAFFLGSDDRYLEVELSPYGQHQNLLISGCHNVVKDSLSCTTITKIDRQAKKWYGKMFIPADHFPPNVSKFNAFAIHTCNGERHYETLYHQQSGNHPTVDFHRLQYFQPIDFHRLLPANKSASLSTIWNYCLSQPYSAPN